MVIKKREREREKKKKKKGIQNIYQKRFTGRFGYSFRQYAPAIYIA